MHTPNDPRDKNTGPMVSLGVGGLLLFGSPLAGLLFSVFGVSRSFDAVEGNGVPPEDKAKVLADGISGSMDALIVGGAGTVLGLVVVVLSLKALAKNRRQAKAAQ